MNIIENFKMLSEGQVSALVFCCHRLEFLESQKAGAKG